METILSWSYRSKNTNIVYRHFMPWTSVLEFTIVSDDVGHNVYLHTEAGAKYLIGELASLDTATIFITRILSKVGRERIVYLGDVNKDG